MLYDKFFNREYLLVIKQKEGKSSLDRLDVKFSVERLHVSSICQSSISVLGQGTHKLHSQGRPRMLPRRRKWN